MGAKLSNTSQQRTQTRDIHHGSSGGAISYQLRAGLANSNDNRSRSRTINNPNRPLQPSRSSIAGTEMEASNSPNSRRRRRRRELSRGDLPTSHSLPAHLFPSFLPEVKCPVCNRTIRSDDVEMHLVQCLTKPRVVYNEDLLTNDCGECIICFEDLKEGEKIARLPCLCIYHKTCIDDWFQRNRCCPEHPEQLPTSPRLQTDDEI